MPYQFGELWACMASAAPVVLAGAGSSVHKGGLVLKVPQYQSGTQRLLDRQLPACGWVCRREAHPCQAPASRVQSTHAKFKALASSRRVHGARARVAPRQAQDSGWYRWGRYRWGGAADGRQMAGREGLGSRGQNTYGTSPNEEVMLKFLQVGENVHRSGGLYGEVLKVRHQRKTRWKLK